MAAFGYTHYIFTAHSCVEGLVQLLTMMRRAVNNMDAQVCGIQSLYPRMAQLGHMLVFFLASLESLHRLPQWLRQLTLLFAGSKGFSLPTSSSTSVVILVVNFDLEWPSCFSEPVPCFLVTIWLRLEKTRRLFYFAFEDQWILFQIFTDHFHFFFWEPSIQFISPNIEWMSCFFFLSVYVFSFWRTAHLLMPAM